MGWIEALLIVTGLAGAAVAWRLVHPLPAVDIGERGILDRRHHLGWIPWEQIEGAYRGRDADGEDAVCLRVRTSERVWRRLRRGRRATSQPMPPTIELALDLSGTDVTEVEVLQAILAHPAEPHDHAPRPFSHSSIVRGQS